jgi:glycosyltransferase involved in cell wall biosynthesis
MSEQTRVLIIHPVDLTQPKVGGVHAFLSTFVGLAPADLTVAHVGIATGSKRGVGRWEEEELDGRAYSFLRLLSLPDPEGRSRIPLGARFTAALIRHRPRIVGKSTVLQFHRPGLAFPYLYTPTPKVQFIHLSSDQLLSRGSESRWRAFGSTLRRVEGIVLPRMNRIVTIGEAATAEYRSRYTALAERIHYLSNWVDDRVFRALSAEEQASARRELELELGANRDDRLVLVIGRLERQKQPLLAVEALARLTDRQIRLGFIGEGSLRSELLRRIAQLNLTDRAAILPTRPRAGLARALAAADALLISSAHETGPTVAFEALSTGTPVASTPVGRVHALVSGSEAGTVAAIGSAQALGDALARVLGGDPMRQRTAALDAVEPYRAAAALAPVYEDHRKLSRSWRA